MTRLIGLAVAALLPLSLVACSGKSAGSPVASASQTGAVGFAQCMRAHGVQNWPDPNSSGEFDKTKVTTQQLKVSSTELQVAQTACQSLLPPASATQQRANVAQALQFSQCVRAHGVANFPDPDGSGRIPDPATAGINQGSPQFQAANVACAQYRPPYIPSNEAYLAYAAAASAS
ncbi:MAG TPA: hypothetical protein VGL75_07540 [Acidothermaceae bacterium]|jgi:hypothetical protein